MPPLRLALTVLGRELLRVDLGKVPAPPAEPVPAKDEGQPEGECPGPVTDRSSAPVTQIGFARPSRHADGSDRWKKS